MCQFCTLRIMAGEDGLPNSDIFYPVIGVSGTPYEKEVAEKIETEWVLRPSDKAELIVETLPLKIKRLDAVLRVADPKRLRSESYQNWRKTLEQEYNRPRLRLKRLLKTPNPLSRGKMPYFCQIWLGKRYLYLANNFACHQDGILRIRGSKQDLASLMREVYQDKEFVSSFIRFLPTIKKFPPEDGTVQRLNGYHFLAHLEKERKSSESAPAHETFGRRTVCLMKCIQNLDDTKTGPPVQKPE